MRCADVAAAPSPSQTVQPQYADFCGYNARSELGFLARTGGSPSLATEHEYAYDPIENKVTFADLGAARTYTANSLNPYAQIPIPPREFFMPQFDDDGIQTSIQTGTGVRRYNHMAGPRLRGKRPMRKTA